MIREQARIKVVEGSVSSTSSCQGRSAQTNITRQDVPAGHASEKRDSRGEADQSRRMHDTVVSPKSTNPGAYDNLSITVDGRLVEIRDQIQMYTTNQLLSHPLVSPVLQPSLGGLPPLLIMTGGGEMLRDEQIFLAHKAANPTKYPPADVYLDQNSEARSIVVKWKPTDVQLQVWDDLCHVAPTLSFTRPAKYMYRSIAQFGAWALARAQQTGIEIPDDDDVSVDSRDSATDTVSGSKPRATREQTFIPTEDTQHQPTSTVAVGKAGDPLPPFRDHMVRQRVDRHGHIYGLEPASSLPALQLPANEIGVIKPGPVRKWLNAKQKWDTRFAKEKRKVQKQRTDEMLQGFEGFGSDEMPPPSALAGRRGMRVPENEKKKMSWGMSLWSLWGSSHDQKYVRHDQSLHGWTWLILSSARA